jgi:hypothetical protein
VYNLCTRISDKYGIDAASEIAEFELANVDAVKEYITNSGADCDFVMTRAVDVQFSSEHNESLRKRYNGFVEAGVTATQTAFYLDGEQAELVCHPAMALRQAAQSVDALSNRN